MWKLTRGEKVLIKNLHIWTIPRWLILRQLAPKRFLFQLWVADLLPRGDRQHIDVRAVGFLIGRSFFLKQSGLFRLIPLSSNVLATTSRTFEISQAGMQAELFNGAGEALYKCFITLYCRGAQHVADVIYK